MTQEKKKLALYVHIPFCIKKCNYCDFLSGAADEQTKDAYLDALVGECRYWKEYLEGYEIHSVFVGGGTPTCLSEGQLMHLQEGIESLLQTAGVQNPEFSVEANPGTLTEEKVRVLTGMGANRISVGLQSSNALELQKLGRIHTYEEFMSAFQLLRDAGLGNINVDVMAALPEQTMDSYRETLERVVKLQPEHISAYSLIVEEETPFWKQQEKGILSLPDEDTEREMDRLTQRYLAEHGYERYEISNYAKPGMECRHNITYWQMGEYLGVGLGASSYFRRERFSNTRIMSEYLSREPVDYIAERHFLTRKEEMEEFVFLGLRMREGISLKEYENRFGVSFYEQYADVLPKFLENSLLAENENHDKIYLTTRGMDVSNMVLAEFLLE
ncbi:MAG: oxygen-independent coproporphyrinogen III oxidase [Lachnospiraceae bacterium]|nr:oxygen-independent coproporphyrinogen III oxidase [Lachnospiraceae bacterium]